MSNTAILINVTSMFCLVFSLIRDRRKSQQAVKAAIHCLIMEPATLSMQTVSGTKDNGITTDNT